MGLSSFCYEIVYPTLRRIPVGCLTGGIDRPAEMGQRGGVGALGVSYLVLYLAVALSRFLARLIRIVLSSY